MNSKIKFCALLASCAIGLSLCGCARSNDNPSGGNNQTGNVNGGNSESAEINSALNDNAEQIINTVKGETKIPHGATAISGKITIEKAGNYYVNSEISGKKITVDCAGVTLYLSNAKLSNEKKVIESNYPLTITLLGENTISNSNAEGSNAVDCAGDLIINGSGSLKIESTKNGIKANSVSVNEATLIIDSGNDGIHAEAEKYDVATSAPAPSYNDGGYVYLNGAKVEIDSDADGIQADTFVYISESNLNIKSGGGAPNGSAGNVSGKGIKAGAIDWGADKTDLDWEGGLIAFKSGEININSNDDAVNSTGEANFHGGKLTIASGDDAIHADVCLNIGGGNVNITKCYEGLEATNVNVSGGEISLVSSDDGINAGGGADGSGFGGNDGGNGWGQWRPRAATPPPSAGSNATPPAINVSGGKIYVDAAGDGLDSNGDIIVSGGEIYVNGPVENMNAAIDYDGSARITGGTVVAVGSSGMMQNFGSASTQGSILHSFSPAGSGAVILKNSNGEELISFTPSKKYSCVVVSCPAIVKGGTYTLSAGGKTVSVSMNGLIYGNGFGGR